MTQITIPIPRDNLVSEKKQKSIVVSFCQNSSLSPPEYHNSVSRFEASGRSIGTRLTELNTEVYNGQKSQQDTMRMVKCSCVQPGFRAMAN